MLSGFLPLFQTLQRWLAAWCYLLWKWRPAHHKNTHTHTHLNHRTYITQHTTSTGTIYLKFRSPNWCSVLILNTQVNRSYLALLAVLWSSTHHLHTSRTQEVTSSNGVTLTAAGHRDTYSGFYSGVQWWKKHSVLSATFFTQPQIRGKYCTFYSTQKNHSVVCTCYKFIQGEISPLYFPDDFIKRSIFDLNTNVKKQN